MHNLHTLRASYSNRAKVDIGGNFSLYDFKIVVMCTVGLVYNVGGGGGDGPMEDNWWCVAW